MERCFYNVADNRYLDVAGNKDEEGQNVQVFKKNGAQGQKWKLVYVDKAEKIPTKGLNKDFGFEINRPFYLVSKLFMKRVVECVGANNLVLKTAAPARNRLGQHFFFDGRSKTIRSQQWKDRSVTISNNGRSNNLRMEPTNARWFQLFRNQNGKIVNERGKVFDVQGNHDRENANMQVHKDLGAKRLNQLFDVVYVDEMPPEPKKGELNKDFGLHVERPFFVVSGLKEERYLDHLGRNMVIKTPNGRSTQLWWFDQRTKTIRSSQNRGWSWDIQGSGRSANMRLWNTNSGWW
jgi:hypothetical protein